jgi:hypothetical protein
MTAGEPYSAVGNIIDKHIIEITAYDQSYWKEEQRGYAAYESDVSQRFEAFDPFYERYTDPEPNDDDGHHDSLNKSEPFKTFHKGLTMFLAIRKGYLPTGMYTDRPEWNGEIFLHVCEQCHISPPTNDTLHGHRKIARVPHFRCVETTRRSCRLLTRR